MRGLAVILLAASALYPGLTAAQDKLGRLFFTPAERNALDAQRKVAGDLANRPVAQKGPEIPKAPPPRMVTLNGVVRRSDGETTIWVNNQAVHERFQEVDVLPGSITAKSVSVKLPGSGRRVKLKVGQSVDSSTGEVEENYRRSPDADTDASATDAAPNRAATASAPETGVIVKPRSKSRPRDEDPTPPASPPAREPARTGSDSDGAMPENR
jgi:hypothetical protein